MKLYEVLDISIMYLGLSEEIKVTEINRTPLSNKKLKALIRCANTVYNEIASDYMPLRNKERLTVIDNKLSYTSFMKRVIDIVKVLKDDEKIAFTVYPNYLEVIASGEVEVIYRYLPEEIKLDDEIAYSIRLAPTTFAAGIAAEYALINNMYEEAAAYERKFKEGLKSNTSDKRPKYIRRPY